MSESIATGMIALAGVLVGFLVQFATAFGERRERHQRLNREKFESLCDLIYTSTLEAQELMGQTGEAALTYKPVSALRAHYIALIYFPELEDVTRTYSNETAMFRKYLYGAGFNPATPASMGAQATMSDPDYTNRVKQLQLSRTKVEEMLQLVAKKYTRA